MLKAEVKLWGGDKELHFEDAASSMNISLLTAVNLALDSTGLMWYDPDGCYTHSKFVQWLRNTKVNESIAIILFLANNQLANLLFVQGLEITTFLKAACCKHNPEQ